MTLLLGKSMDGKDIMCWIKQCCSSVVYFLVDVVEQWGLFCWVVLFQAGESLLDRWTPLLPRPLVLPYPPMLATTGSHLPQINHLPPSCAPPSVTRGQENRLARAPGGQKTEAGEMTNMFHSYIKDYLLSRGD